MHGTCVDAGGEAPVDEGGMRNDVPMCTNMLYCMYLRHLECGIGLDAL